MTADQHSSDSDFIGRLNYSATLPLAWEVVAEMPSAEQISVLNEGNETLLRALAVINDGPVDASDENTPLATELQRIDIMLNLLLVQVNKLVAAQAGSASGRRFRLDLYGLEWFDADAPAFDAWLGVDIHLHPALQLPLRVFGRVCQSGRGDEVPTQLKFASLTSAVEEELQRFIFRQHRRHIAARAAHRQENASDDH